MRKRENRDVHKEYGAAGPAFPAALSYDSPSRSAAKLMWLSHRLSGDDFLSVAYGATFCVAEGIPCPFFTTSSEKDIGDLACGAMGQ